jgi:Na+/H+ antiporter NhaD/arsenite permease-like protein
MLTAIVLCFVIGYLSIVFEHPLKLDKSVPALLMGSLIWAVIAVGQMDIVGHEHHIVTLEEGLLHHLGKTAEILVFLLGAMTIVELVDLHKGFSVITDFIQTRNKRKLLWVLSTMAFFLSAILDNLTCTIVFISLLRKIIPDKNDRIWFIAFVVIAANAGGAFSPIGDVTTTMLWIGKKVTTQELILRLFIPSVACAVVPLIIGSFSKHFSGDLPAPTVQQTAAAALQKKLLSSRTMLIAGIGALLFVPVFKTITHLPPYMGMMLSLGVVWLISEYIKPEEDFEEERKEMYSARKALSRIELSSIIFFLGILMAVAGLESVVSSYLAGKPLGLLASLAENLRHYIPNQDIVVVVLGFLSAVIDNVPLVAASMGMYPMDAYPTDNHLWHFIAYCAGTGGSMLIIGSAAGVAAMGMERIDFIWYLRKFSWIAMLGFLAGAAVYILMLPLFE